MSRIIGLIAFLICAAPAFAANYRVGLGDDCGNAPVCFEPTPTTIRSGDSGAFFISCDLICTAAANVVSDDRSFRCARGCDGAGGDGTPADYASRWTFTRTFEAFGAVTYSDQASDAVGTVVVVAPPLVDIGPGFTGSWYDPTQVGHGIFLEILANNQVFLGWFTFNPEGTQQAWFGGVGTYSGNVATVSAVDMPTGGKWIPHFDPAQIVHNPWGRITLTFSDCNHGRIYFDSTLGFGSGTMDLARLTQPEGLSCP